MIHFRIVIGFEKLNVVHRQPTNIAFNIWLRKFHGTFKLYAFKWWRSATPLPPSLPDIASHGNVFVCNVRIISTVAVAVPATVTVAAAAAAVAAIGKISAKTPSRHMIDETLPKMDSKQ